MMTRINPTSVGLFSSKGRIAFRPAISFSFWAWAAALRTDKVLVYDEMVGEGDFHRIDEVDHATPGYFLDCKSIIYLFLSNMLA